VTPHHLENHIAAVGPFPLAVLAIADRRKGQLFAAVHESLDDAVDGSSTGT
jgi:hypothetical protein